MIHIPIVVVKGYQRHCDYTEANNGRSSKPASKLSNAICIICSRVDFAALPICGNNTIVPKGDKKRKNKNDKNINHSGDKKNNLKKFKKQTN